jgi:predicted unusual protein kinase regulating ubiquinone biosynthesis (AarF/ABC1/UbiB family)
MKGVLMKVGQMASYVDEGLSPTVRRTLSRLQDSVPPMSPELAAQVIQDELGAPPERLFARWDPLPIAAASIGQVHRAMTSDGRVVAVKVQYPGIAEIITADLDNVRLLRSLLRISSPGLDVEELLAELRERVLEELDYDLEAGHQRRFADYYAGHPTIHVPRVVDELSTRRVITSELVDGARFTEAASWSQEERDLAGESIYRFVCRSLYELHSFNGDPHPGNYLFHGGGQVSFVDFGLVKRIWPHDLRPIVDAVRALCIDGDEEGFRRGLEDAGFLHRAAPVSTETVVEQWAIFYEMIRAPRRVTVTPEYSSELVRRCFDVRGPLAPYATVPRAYAILQRINVGLFGVLGELRAAANWRAIAEEIWPFVHGPPSTPIGEAEASWFEQRRGHSVPPS